MEPLNAGSLATVAVQNGSSTNSPGTAGPDSLGLKAPRGWGWITNPKKAAYNRVYNRTTRGCLVMVVAMLVALSGLGLLMAMNL